MSQPTSPTIVTDSSTTAPPDSQLQTEEIFQKRSSEDQTPLEQQRPQDASIAPSSSGTVCENQETTASTGDLLSKQRLSLVSKPLIQKKRRLPTHNKGNTDTLLSHSEHELDKHSFSHMPEERTTVVDQELNIIKGDIKEVEESEGESTSEEEEEEEETESEEEREESEEEEDETMEESNTKEVDEAEEKEKTSPEEEHPLEKKKSYKEMGVKLPVLGAIPVLRKTQSMSSTMMSHHKAGTHDENQQQLQEENPITFSLRKTSDASRSQPEPAPSQSSEPNQVDFRSVLKKVNRPEPTESASEKPTPDSCAQIDFRSVLKKRES